MKKEILVLLCLVASTAFAEDTIKLPESNIKSDYIEIDRLKPTKNIIKSGLGIIDIRGQGMEMANKNIRILVDGVAITSLTSHPFKFDYNIVPVDQIEKIEIIPGGSSVFYGSGAAGGVINVTTQAVKSLDKGYIDTSYKKDENRWGVGYSKNITDKFNINLSYSKVDRDLYFKHTFRNTDYFNAALKYKINKNNNISLGYSNMSEKSKYLENIAYEKIKKDGRNALPNLKTVKYIENGRVKKKKIIPYKIGDRDIHSLGFGYESKLMNNLIFKYNFGKIKGKYIGNDNEERYVNFSSDSHKLKLNYLYGNGNFKGSNVLFGYDRTNQKSKLQYDEIGGYGKRPKIKKYNFNYKKDIEAFYLFNTLKYNNFTFTQGFRKDYTKWDTEKTDKKSIYSKTNKLFEGKNKRKNSAFSLGVAYSYSDSGKIYANYEKAFRSPDGIEITDYYWRKKAYQLSNVKDEKYNLYELGLRDYILGSSINLVGFYSETKNEIARPLLIIDGERWNKSLNLYNTTRYGVEISLEQKINNFYFKEEYSYIKGKRKYTSEKDKYDISFIHKFSKDSLDKVPTHKVNLKAGYNFTSRLSADLSYLYSGKYTNYIVQGKDNPGIKIKSNSVVDLAIKYHHENGISIYGGINNLFNENYYSYSSPEGVINNTHTIIPEDRRTFYIGAKYIF